MEKLNKVIAGLECCLSDTDCDECCPYFKGEYRMDGCMDEMMAEALELLKECRGLEKKLELEKNGRLLLSRMYQKLKEEHEQTELTLEVTRMNLGDTREELNRAEDELADLRRELAAAVLREMPNDYGEYPPEFPKEGM